MMKKMRILPLALALCLACCLLAACGGSAAGDLRTYKLGVTGTDFEIWEGVSDRLADKGIKLEIITFSDYTKPNLALSEGEIHLNAFQTVAFFDNFVEAHGLDLTNVAYTVVAPMGIYSEKITRLEDAPENATVAIPNDQTNGGRAIKYLEALGFLTVDPGAGLIPSLLDVTSYTKPLSIVEMNATQIPRSLQDVDFALINNGVAFEAGLTLKDSAIIFEDPDLPHMVNYWNIIAVRTGDQDNADIKAIVTEYQSDTTKAHINEKYGGQNIPVF